MRSKASTFSFGFREIEKNRTRRNVMEDIRTYSKSPSADRNNKSPYFSLIVWQKLMSTLITLPQATQPTRPPSLTNPTNSDLRRSCSLKYGILGALTAYKPARKLVYLFLFIKKPERGLYRHPVYLTLLNYNLLVVNLKNMSAKTNLQPPHHLFWRWVLWKIRKKCLLLLY